MANEASTRYALPTVSHLVANATQTHTVWCEQKRLSGSKMGRQSHCLQAHEVGTHEQ